MDYAATLVTFGALLSIVAVIGAALAFLLAHDRYDKRGPFKRRLLAGGTFMLLLGTLATQYVAAPSTSLLTLIPGVPFPGSTLDACHVSGSELPPLAGGQSIASHVPGLAGQRIRIGGSSALSQLFTGAAAHFDAANGTTTAVSSSNSQAGLQLVHSGALDLGLSDIFVRDAPDDTVKDYVLQDHAVAVAVFAVLVSPDLAGIVQNLTTDQLIGIYNGTLTNWRQIGGPDQRITPIGRAVGSGTRVTFESYVLHGQPNYTGTTLAGTTADLANALARSHGAIGYIATSALGASDRVQVHPVCIDGARPTLDDINNGAYQFWNYEHVYVNLPQSGALAGTVRAFLAYVCSASFQANEVLGQGYLRIPDLSAVAMQTHRRQGYPPLGSCAP
jgi:phosphate transport system substrate-binding protein